MKYSYSTLIFYNNADEYNLACPTGTQLENQHCVTALDKGITITFTLRLVLDSELNPDKAY